MEQEEVLPEEALGDLKSQGSSSKNFL